MKWKARERSRVHYNYVLLVHVETVAFVVQKLLINIAQGERETENENEREIEKERSVRVETLLHCIVASDGANDEDGA